MYPILFIESPLTIFIGLFILEYLNTSGGTSDLNSIFLSNFNPIIKISFTELSKTFTAFIPFFFISKNKLSFRPLLS